MSKEGQSPFQLGLEYDQLIFGLRKQYGVIYQLASIPVLDFQLYPDGSREATDDHIIHGIIFLREHGKDQFLRNLGRDANTLINQGRVGIVSTRDMRWELWKANFPKETRDTKGILQFDDPQILIPGRSEPERILRVFIPQPDFLLKVQTPALLMADVTLMASVMKDILHGREEIDSGNIITRATACMSHFLCQHLIPDTRQKLAGRYRQALQEFPYGLILGCENLLYGEDRNISDPWSDWGEFNYG